LTKNIVLRGKLAIFKTLKGTKLLLLKIVTFLKIREIIILIYKKKKMKNIYNGPIKSTTIQQEEFKLEKENIKFI